MTGGSHQVARRLLTPVLDVAQLVLAFVVALPSLAYPFGRDQGLFHYVAREWLRHGALPYRDVFEQKPPGIFAVHAACIALFGERAWGIRVAELSAVAAIGLLAGSLDRARPMRATTVLGSSILYYGFLGFWDTAQCELWCALFVAASLCAIERLDVRRGAPLGGLLFGLALVMKPPIALFGAVLAWRLRRRRAGARPLAAAAIASLLPWAATLAYFAARGGLADLVDVQWRANALYAANEHVVGADDWITGVLDIVRSYAPLSTFLLYASCALAFFHRRDPERADPHRLVLACTLAALATVLVQGKLSVYHYGVLMVPAPLAVAVLAREARERWPAGSAIAFAHLVGLFLLSWPFEHLWLRSALALGRYEVGSLSRDRAYEPFAFPAQGFSVVESEAVATWLRDHVRPGDRVCVRGFEPQVYALAGVSCTSRFFWTYWLTAPGLAYRREEWLAQDRRALTGDAPRFATVKVDARPGGVDSEPYMADLGYARVAQVGSFVVMERAPRPLP